MTVTLDSLQGVVQVAPFKLFLMYLSSFSECYVHQSVAGPRLKVPVGCAWLYSEVSKESVRWLVTALFLFQEAGRPDAKVRRCHSDRRMLACNCQVSDWERAQ